MKTFLIALGGFVGIWTMALALNYQIEEWARFGLFLTGLSIVGGATFALVAKYMP